MTDQAYTDAHLLNQIAAECETAIELGVPEHPSVVRTLLEGFIRKIEAQQRGERWWEPSA
jgi:hypothetical protein